MKWLINLFKSKGNYEVVYSKSGTWEVTISKYSVRVITQKPCDVPLNL